MPNRENNFPPATIRIVAQRASFLCSKPDCRILTTAAPLSGIGVDMVGEAAHIIAASSGGPRGGESLAKYSIPSLTSEGNALWLCPLHHKQIDDHPELYPVETLLTWKAAAEDFTRQNLGRNPFQSSPGSLSYTPPLLPDPFELPPCVNLPPGSLLRFNPNAAFTGRRDELLFLAHHLLYSTQNTSTSRHIAARQITAITQPAALSGSGGIGKTQLAVEFCYRYGQFFHAVHWLQADQDLNPQIALCGREMGLSPWPETLPDQVALTLQAWQRQPHRLVVLDNLTDPQLLLELPDEMRAVRLLITSRRAAYDPTLGVRTRQLELLPRPDSLALLRKLAPRLADVPDRALDSLAERLGDYPLALHLAGMYLNKVQFTTPAPYLKQLDQPGNALDQAFEKEWVKTNPTHYEHNASQAFLLSWDQLDPADPADALARRFFLATGYCAVNTPSHPRSSVGWLEIRSMI